MSDPARKTEVAEKIRALRGWLGDGRALRLRGVDWFSWLTAGGSSAVLLAAETGIAEAVVTPDGAWVVTDEIEAERLSEEQLPEGLAVLAHPWAEPSRRQAIVDELTGGRAILSDRPGAGEAGLTAEMVAAKRTLLEPEIERYRKVGVRASQAMTAALAEATPAWNESRLAAAAASALMARGLEPALVMAAGESRMQRYRHPVTAAAPLERAAMLVFCARGFGLYANLTRFVSFGPLPAHLAERHRLVLEVETAVLDLSRPGMQLDSIYEGLANAYAAIGHGRAIFKHHQGGTTGYLSREVVATPDTKETLRVGSAVAWNPSLAGAKVEDTFLITENGLENLTLDPSWPTTTIGGRKRPLVLQK
jgi:Xaa-Pro aminopeptidase